MQSINIMKRHWLSLAIATFGLTLTIAWAKPTILTQARPKHMAELLAEALIL